MTIVALGDSTTAGTPAFRSPVEAPPEGSGDERSQYAYWIMKKRPLWRVLNRGVNGERTDEIFRRFDSDVLVFRPEVVIVLAGVNDLYQGYPAALVKTNLKAIYDKARTNEIRVIACTILPYNSISPDVRLKMKEVNDWIETHARENGLGFCDLFRAVENTKRPWTLAGSPDGLHPDVFTYRKMGETLIGPLEKLISEPTSPRSSR